ncbi:TonB-dependent receptor [Ginsengibacter hankyongi]|uniref:TonB-dependent receptor n=1 Tax=Ginsengibacter hankyongi TaxID=2607284 RepID=A0A5J5IDK2_9BACT|nr:TonB-dependent receptor [Ginsengibacter hankyongi]KAA9034381.1 TonB-dependent receptor [Ginsengibacter hankyongi]
MKKSKLLPWNCLWLFKPTMSFRKLHLPAKIMALVLFWGSALPAYSRPSHKLFRYDLQQIVISGKVTDESTGQPLAGVNIMYKGTSTGTVADKDGKYSIEVSGRNATLVFTFTGYVTQEIKVGGKTSIDVALVVKPGALNEVVVVGYGTQKKSSVTGALTSIKAEDVQDIPVGDLSNALAGRMSGVFVNQASGVPGYDASIRVRSVNTWKSTGNNPLYVIDGVISDKQAFDAMDFSEVDNITVLKDAASGAIYGARAANGVILVTTKTGKIGKFQLSYNYSYTGDKPSKIPQYVGAKDMVKLENYMRTGVGLPVAYDPQEVAYFDKNDPALAWHSLTARNPTLNRHTLTASGGTEKVKYFISGSYFDQTAAVENVDFKRYNIRSNLTVNFTKNFSGFVNMQYSHGFNERFSYWNGGVGFSIDPDLGSIWGRTLYYLPNAKPETADGKFINPGWIGNLVGFIEQGGTESQNQNNVDMLVGLTYKVPFVDGLSLSGKVSPTYLATTVHQLDKKVTIYDVAKQGSNGAIYTDSIIGSQKSAYPSKEKYAESQEITTNYQLDFSANYAKKFRKHSFDALALYEQSEGKYDYFYGARENFPLVQTGQFWATSSSRTDSYVDGNQSENGRASYVGRILYNYDEKYFLNVTTRVDGSMLFAPGHRWGTFPSVSGGWVASNENFFKVKYIDYLKLRGSWGLTGNDAVGGWKWQESYSVNGDYLFGTTPQPRLQYDGIINPDLTWEKTREFNFGIDSRLFKNILFTAEYYKGHNYDILDTRTVSLPSSFGGALPPENYGIVDTHGYELELGYNGNLGKVSYGVKGNFAYATNKVVLKDVAQNALSVDNPNGRSTDYVSMLVSTGIIRNQKALDALPSGYTIYGIKPTLGALNFQDVSGPGGVPDGRIDDYDRQVIKGKHYRNPYTFGLNLNARWNGFGANIFVQGITGISKLYDDGYGRRFFDGARPPSFWLNSWSENNPNAAYPKPVPWDYTRDNVPSTFWLKNSSYLRLQYVNLTYSLPRSICDKIKISNVTFILSGTNLFTITKFNYYDPAAADMNSYPTMRSLTMGANVVF